jgi:hypothetical protein
MSQGIKFLPKSSFHLHNRLCWKKLNSQCTLIQTSWLLTAEAENTCKWAHTHRTSPTPPFLLHQCIPKHLIPISQHVYEHTYSLHCVDTGTEISRLWSSATGCCAILQIGIKILGEPDASIFRVQAEQSPHTGLLCEI